MIACIAILVVFAFILPRFEPRKVYLLAIGQFSSPSIEELIVYYNQKYGLAIEILPIVPMEPWLTDYKRRQLIAEELIEQIKRQYPQLAGDRTAVLIGITSRDMYIRSSPWKFAFSWRQEGRFAVVSTAPMDPVFFGRQANASLLQLRVRKIITKNIGLMYYGHFQSNDPKSVLYRSILSVDDLDRVGEEF